VHICQQRLELKRFKQRTDTALQNGKISAIILHLRRKRQVRQQQMSHAHWPTELRWYQTDCMNDRSFTIYLTTHIGRKSLQTPVAIQVSIPSTTWYRQPCDVVRVQQCHPVRLESIFLGLGLSSIWLKCNFNDLESWDSFHICKFRRFKTFVILWPQWLHEPCTEYRLPNAVTC